MQHTEPRQVLRWVAAVVITMVVAVPVAFILFAMGLFVREAVIGPTAALATSVVASLIGSWTADGLSRDGKRTLVNQVVARSLLWGLIPAALILLTLFVGAPVRPPGVWVGLVVVYTSVVGVILAFRHRSEKTPPPARTLPTLWWLAGTVAAVAVVIFIASLFGLTGA